MTNEERYKNALEKISKTVVKDGEYEGDYESAYWDMVLEADQALYYDGEDN